MDVLFHTLSMGFRQLSETRTKRVTYFSVQLYRPRTQICGVSLSTSRIMEGRSNSRPSPHSGIADDNSATAILLVTDGFNSTRPYSKKPAALTAAGFLLVLAGFNPRPSYSQAVGATFHALGGSAGLSDLCAWASHSGISICCGHFSRHSPHSTHLSARVFSSSQL